MPSIIVIRDANGRIILYFYFSLISTPQYVLNQKSRMLNCSEKLP